MSVTKEERIIAAFILVRDHAVQPGKFVMPEAALDEARQILKAIRVHQEHKARERREAVAEEDGFRKYGEGVPRGTVVFD